MRTFSEPGINDADLGKIGLQLAEPNANYQPGAKDSLTKRGKGYGGPCIAVWLFNEGWFLGTHQSRTTSAPRYALRAFS